MSRRSHPRGHRGARPARAEGSSPPRHPTSPSEPARRAVAPESVDGHVRPVDPAPRTGAPITPIALPGESLARAAAPPVHLPGEIDAGPPPDTQASIATPVTDGATYHQPAPTNGHALPVALNPGCTAPQLRRFIKSRAWVPMHELRRRFGINGADDDVTPVAVDGSTIFVGLPTREGHLLGELLRAGDIGYELSLDPSTPIVIGVYPMRPVPRH